MSKKNRPSIAERRAAMLAIDAENGGSHLAKPKPDDLAARLDRVAGQPAPAKPDPLPTDGRRFRKSAERMTSVSVPRELQRELRRLTLDASSDQGRRVATWELIAEALLGADWLAEARLRVDD